MSHNTLFLKHPQEKQRLLEKLKGLYKCTAPTHPLRPGHPLHPRSDGMLEQLKP